MLHDARNVLLGLGAFAALATGPAWWSAARGGKGAPPDLERPVRGKTCIEPTSFMRARHMQLLDAWRDAVVRRAERVYVASDGQKHDMSLTGTCLSCHADPDKFCNRCHAYAGVDAYCWDCHQTHKRSGT